MPDITLDRHDSLEPASGLFLVDSSGSRRVPFGDLPATLIGLRAPEAPVTWLHAALSDDLVAALEESGLHELAVKSLRDGPERPRVEEYPDHLYVSLLRAVDGGGTAANRPMLEIEDVRVFLGPRWIISLGGLDVDELATVGALVSRQVMERGRGPSFVLYYLAEWAVGTLYPVLDELDERVDALEDLVLVDTGDATRQELFHLKRDLAESRRRIAPTRDVMQRLSTHGLGFVEPGADVFFRDVHDDILLVLEQLDTHRDILSSALDLHLSSVSNRLNEVMKRLTVVATVFMPLTFITGFFGMNFVDLPVGSVVWYWLTLASMVVVFVAMVGYAWRRHWL
ncbi:MAG: magnesium transporter CorA family protein [Thermoleophilia bacterium]